MEDPFVQVMEPVVAGLRAAVEENPAFELVESGILYQERYTLAMGVACRRTEGQFRDLTLELRCARTHLPEGRGWIGGNVRWERDPWSGRKVFEMFAEEVNYEGEPPVALFAERLAALEQAMRLALARGSPPGLTHRVLIMESEPGWGVRVDEVIEFASRDEARRYAGRMPDAHLEGEGP